MTKLFFYVLIVFSCIATESKSNVLSGSVRSTMAHIRNQSDERNPFQRIDVRSRSKHVVPQNNNLLWSKDIKKWESWDRWFIFSSIGIHRFFGDYSCIGNPLGTLSPECSIGIGKWIAPWIALKSEIIYSDTRGYTRFEKDHYGYGEIIYSEYGIPYRKMKTRWIDFNVNVMFNISHLFFHEKAGTTNHVLTGSLGLGAVHHIMSKGGYGSDNELSAHVELQYSRYITSSRQWSVDVKLRGIFYKVNPDIVNAGGSSLSCNAGIDIGLSWYFTGKKKKTMYKHRQRYEAIDVQEKESKQIETKPRHTQSKILAFDISLEQLAMLTINDSVKVFENLVKADVPVGVGKKNDGKEIVVRFSDIYAYLHRDTADVLYHIDSTAVSEIADLLSKGVPTIIEIHGYDRKSGIYDIGTKSPTQSVASWIEKWPALHDANLLIYVDKKDAVPDSIPMISVKIQVLI